MASNGNGARLDLLLKLAADVERLDQRAAGLGHTADQVVGTVRRMAAAVAELGNNVQALSEQVHEFRVGVGAMKDSFDQVGAMLREVLSQTGRIEDLERRVHALEAKS